jgi:predicted RNA binding protein YcfA (HicA-like mRNA interferase family)
VSLPQASGARVVRALEKLGFARTGGKGSHVKLRKGPHVVIVPQHPELALGTMRSVLKQAGIDAATLRGAL